MRLAAGNLMLYVVNRHARAHQHLFVCLAISGNIGYASQHTLMHVSFITDQLICIRIQPNTPYGSDVHILYILGEVTLWLVYETTHAHPFAGGSISTAFMHRRPQHHASGRTIHPHTHSIHNPVAQQKHAGDSVRTKVRVCACV